MQKGSPKLSKNVVVRDIDKMLNRLETELGRYVYYRHITKDLKTGKLIDIHSFVYNIKGHLTGFSIPDTDFNFPSELEQRLHDSIAQAKFEIELNN